MMAQEVSSQPEAVDGKREFLLAVSYITYYGCITDG